MSEWQTKRFVVMGGLTYYATGGFEDYLESYDTKEEAETFAHKWLTEHGWGDNHDQGYWTQVADLSTGEFWVKGDRACNPMGVFM
jgi:hypothetical protein